MSTTAQLNRLFGDRRPTAWITRERPKIDRIACPWLIRRVIDPDAVFHFAPAKEVLSRAKAEGLAAFDIPGAPFSHVGELCSFDAFITGFGLQDPALDMIATIVRGADTDRHDLAAEAAGLHAISIGLNLVIDDDHALLEAGFRVYDGLYAWASRARSERHSWRPA